MSKIINNIIIFALVFIGIMLVGVVLTLPAKTSAWNGYAQESEAIFHTYNGSSNNTGSVIVNGNTTVAQNPVPFITSLEPEIVGFKSGAKVIEIKGGNFVPSSVVRVDNSNRLTTYVNSTTLAVKLNSSDTSKLGDHLIVVRNPAPGGGTSNVVVLEVKRNVNANASGSTNSENGSVLGANAVGSGFMPSTFLQWLFLAILILFIIILWRKSFAKKNEKMPLKQA